MTTESIIAASREGFLITGAELLTGIFIVSAAFIIGFLFKNVINLWTPGIMLKLSRPFRVGDTISTIGATGVVETMGLSTTVLTTSDNTTVFLPNRDLLKTSIFNHSAKGSRRIAIGFIVLSDEDIEAARDIIEEVLDKNPRILTDPSPEVPVVDYNDKGAVLLAQFWTSADGYKRIRTDVTVSMLRLLRAEGIRIQRLEDSLTWFGQVVK